LEELTAMNDTSPRDECPLGASLPPDEISRREFLRVMGASLAMAGAASCTKQPKEEIVPYVRQPEDLVLGDAQYYATAMDIGGQAQGLLVCSHEGRPTKIEGNPLHPITQGRSSVLMQAVLLDLYDPDRSQSVRKEGMAGTWEDFLNELLLQTARWKTEQGRGLRLLVDSRSSPTLQEQIDALRQKYPKVECHRYDAAFPPITVTARNDFSHARVVLTLDADFLGAPDALPKDILDFTAGRQQLEKMNRLYAIEPMPSLTGAMADHRLMVTPSKLVTLARQLADAAQKDAPPSDPWLASVWKDLKNHHSECLVVAGRFAPESVQRAAWQINERLGNVDHTVFAMPETPAAPGIEPLVKAMQAGEVSALVMIGVNPIFTAPDELRFVEALKRVPFSVHLGPQADETATFSRWHIPESHFLESWSDERARDGTLSVVQPLIEPLYPSKSAHELLAAFLEQVPGSGYEIIRAAWQRRHPGNDFEPWWRRVLHDGVFVPQKSSPAASPPANASASANPQGAEAKGLELVIRPDPHLLDGRHANNSWLQELPKPLSKVTWGNAAILSPHTASEQHLVHGDMIELKRGDRAVTAPVFVLPGHADDCVTLHLGHGRTKAGRVGNDVGFNAAVMQTLQEPWGGAGLSIRKIAGRHVFATTHDHQRMEGRDLVHVESTLRSGSGQDVGSPNLFRVPSIERESPPGAEDAIFPPVTYKRPAWGMVIDLSRCIGCSACTMACQAENNIPVVGSEQVKRGREMHWIRVDRYYEGSAEKPETLHQPVPCMQCENAPCELVCPVGATLHDHQGLNLMVYNRCVGTRYCSNNCPYKVRRFNFLKFNDDTTPQLKLMRNPDVTVRMRGVMEKCTYCVQRIAVVRIKADKENREIRDGEVVPACAQACPADAIVFGDILDKASRVSAQRESPRQYTLLAELNTRPRTTYLSKLRNPNPESIA
jgi:molybdopterin-containing oxidoreductase family iron-sulfur binding subunit